MKVYKVKVNGKVFEVELEAVSEKAGSVAAPAAAAPAKEEPAPVVTGGASIKAPIAGKLLSVKVNVGDTIKVGQVVAVIEAMKLENEVPSPVAGKVAAINVKVGSQVNNGDVIITLA